MEHDELDAGAHPVELHAEYEDRRSRLTTFFRILLVIPHALFVAVWGAVVMVVAVVAWFAILITGRYPRGLWNLAASWLRYQARVSAYSWLVSDPFPPFSGEGEGSYPVYLEVRHAERQSRLKTLFRPILYIPAYILQQLLQVAMYAVAVILWLIIVITGRAPKALVDFQTTCQRWDLRSWAYIFLIVDRYPSFDSAHD